MNFDLLAKPLGIFLKFIYDIAFENYGLAIIIFTFIVRTVMLPLTVKQHKSTSKMQEIQPLINDIQKRYKDDKEKMNQELMKVYQEHNYNPAGGCLPMLIQMPIILTLYWVVVQPLKFMLGKSKEAITAIVEVAAKGQAAINSLLDIEKIPKTVEEVVKSWGIYGEIRAMNYFNEHQAELSQVAEHLKSTDLIDFRSFLGLHLGEIASYDPGKLFGPEWKTYIPLMILVLLATVTTFISSKLAMPKTTNQQSGPAGCSSNSMLYIGPVMTLMFSFQLPAGVILYWMVGYVFAIFQQLYINKHILKKNAKPLPAIAGNGSMKGEKITDGEASSTEKNGTIDSGSSESKKQLPAGENKNTKNSANNKTSNNKKGGNKKGGKKKGGKKK